jgi:tetraacyldisaccharide 4'-kinase
MIKLNYPNFWQRQSIVSYLLLPLSFIFYFGTLIRKKLANPILFKPIVICVGNATIGGTGKTQVVSWVASLLNKHKINFVIVTKGYGSCLKKATLVNNNHIASDVGDESILLRKYGSVVASKKIKEIIPIIDRLAPDVIICDDGMQNPGFFKNYTILVVDGYRGFGNRLLFPAGPLRQSCASAAWQSDAVIVVGKHELSNLKGLQDKIVLAAEIKAISEFDKKEQYIAFSGIGNNQRFFGTLKAYGLNVMREISFPDHYNYTEADLKELRSLAKNLNAKLITTEKDYVKINDKRDIECFQVELEIKDSDKLEKLIYEKILKKN